MCFSSIYFHLGVWDTPASGARRTRVLLVRLLIPMHWDSVYCTDAILSFPSAWIWAALSDIIFLLLLLLGRLLPPAAAALIVCRYTDVGYSRIVHAEIKRYYRTPSPALGTHYRSVLTSIAPCPRTVDTSIPPSSSLSFRPCHQHYSPQYYSRSPSPTAHSSPTPRTPLLSSPSLAPVHLSHPAVSDQSLPAPPRAPRSASGTHAAPASDDDAEAHAAGGGSGHRLVFRVGGGGGQAGSMWIFLPWPCSGVSGWRCSGWMGWRWG
jgi:hypothetical protein